MNVGQQDKSITLKRLGEYLTIGSMAEAVQILLQRKRAKTSERPRII